MILATKQDRERGKKKSNKPRQIKRSLKKQLKNPVHLLAFRYESVKSIPDFFYNKCNFSLLDLEY